MKKIFLYFVVLCIFIIPQFVRAQVVISEIMYDVDGTDTDREWVEVQNTGSTSIDLSSWKFFEANTNHGLVPDGSASLAAGAYAVIVEKVDSFKSDWPNFSGLIFDSSFSLNNDPGETLAIKDGTGTIIDQVAYTADPSGAHSGKSLQKAGSTWVTAAPTVGAANATTSDTDASGSNANGSGSGSTAETDTPSPVKKPTEITVAKISAEIISDTSAIVGKEMLFEPKVLGLSGEKMQHGKFVWNFGDGASVTKDTQDKVFHTYKYAGEYVVILNYFSNPYIPAIIPDASDRIILTVQIHGLSIASFEKDGSVSIKNSDTKEFNLSGWILASGSQRFIFPNGTIILPGKTLTIAPDLTGFQNASGGEEVTLSFPNATLAATFPVKKIIAVMHSASSHTARASVVPTSPLESIIPEASASDLTASAADALPVSSAKRSVWPVILFAILIVSAISSALYVRRKKNSSSEEMSADDIAIMDS